MWQFRGFCSGNMETSTRLVCDLGKTLNFTDACYVQWKPELNLPFQAQISRNGLNLDFQKIAGAQIKADFSKTGKAGSLLPKCVFSLITDIGKMAACVAYHHNEGHAGLQAPSVSQLLAIYFKIHSSVLCLLPFPKLALVQSILPTGSQSCVNLSLCLSSLPIPGFSPRASASLKCFCFYPLRRQCSAHISFCSGHSR